MKSLTLWITAAIILVNSTAGALIGDYNVIGVLLFNGSAIVAGAVAYFAAKDDRLSFPFKAAIYLTSVGGFLMNGILSILSPAQVVDNYYLIALVAVGCIQILISFALKVATRSVGEIPFPG